MRQYFVSLPAGTSCKQPSSIIKLLNREINAGLVDFPRHAKS
jgi:hypothetical protein